MMQHRCQLQLKAERNDMLHYEHSLQVRLRVICSDHTYSSGLGFHRVVIFPHFPNISSSSLVITIHLPTLTYYIINLALRNWRPKCFWIGTANHCQFVNIGYLYIILWRIWPFARQRQVKHVPSATNTHTSRVNNACSMDTETGLALVAQQQLRTQ
jgi:hypothetical protein